MIAVNAVVFMKVLGGNDFNVELIERYGFQNIQFVALYIKTKVVNIFPEKKGFFKIG